MVTLDPAEVRPVITRLKRARGQLDGVIRMLEEGRDCEEVVTQIAAVSKAIERAGFTTIATGMRQCLAEEFQADSGREAVTEAGAARSQAGRESAGGRMAQIRSEQTARMEKLFLSLA